MKMKSFILKYASKIMFYDVNIACYHTPQLKLLLVDESFSCFIKTQRRWSKKIYKIELTKTRYDNQVLGKYRVDPQREGLTLIAELTGSNLGLKGVLNKRK